MKDYKLTDTDTIIRAKDGAAIPADPRNGDRRDYEAWLVAGNVPDAADPRPAQDRVLSPRQFRSRLTSDEQAAITVAAMSNADVFAWRLAAAEAQEIDLDHADTVTGLQFLVAMGLLTQARMDEVRALQV